MEPHSSSRPSQPQPQHNRRTRARFRTDLIASAVFGAVLIPLLFLGSGRQEPKAEPTATAAPAAAAFTPLPPLQQPRQVREGKMAITYLYKIGDQTVPDPPGSMSTTALLDDNSPGDDTTGISGGVGQDPSNTSTMQVVAVADLGAGATLEAASLKWTTESDGYWKAWYSNDGVAWTVLDEDLSNAFSTPQETNLVAPGGSVAARYVAFGVVSWAGVSSIFDFRVTYTPGSGDGECTPPAAPVIDSAIPSIVNGVPRITLTGH